jgi:hypothetical protein
MSANVKASPQFDEFCLHVVLQLGYEPQHDTIKANRGLNAAAARMLWHTRFQVIAREWVLSGKQGFTVQEFRSWELWHKVVQFTNEADQTS